MPLPEEISDGNFSDDDEILLDKILNCEIRDSEISDGDISDGDFTFGGVTYGINHRFRYRGLEIVSMYFINNNNSNSADENSPVDENSPDDEKSSDNENSADENSADDESNSADENSDGEVSSDDSTFREISAKAAEINRKFVSMRLPDPPPIERGEDPGYFKGRIFIGDMFRLREVYNSANEGKLYTELPTSLNSKRKRVEEEEEEEEEEKVDLPMMGPCAGFQMIGHFTVVVHHHCGDSSKESSYVDNVGTSHYVLMKKEWSLLDDWQNFEIPRRSIPIPSSSIPIPMTSLDKSIQLKVEGPLRTLVLNCVVINDSLTLCVQIKWFFHDETRLDDEGIYICGELAVLSANGVKSVLFKTPPKMGIMASVGSPISLPKSVVHIPYASDFKVMADLFSPDTTNDTTVIGEVDFLEVEKKAAATEYFKGFNAEGFDVRYSSDVGYSGTEDFNDKWSKSRLSFYRSTKTIQGNGAYIQVSVIVEAFK